MEVYCVSSKHVDDSFVGKKIILRNHGDDYNPCVNFCNDDILFSYEHTNNLLRMQKYEHDDFLNIHSGMLEIIHLKLQKLQGMYDEIKRNIDIVTKEDFSLIIQNLRGLFCGMIVSLEKRVGTLTTDYNVDLETETITCTSHESKQTIDVDNYYCFKHMFFYSDKDGNHIEFTHRYGFSIEILVQSMHCLLIFDNQKPCVLNVNDEAIINIFKICVEITDMNKKGLTNCMTKSAIN